MAPAKKTRPAPAPTPAPSAPATREAAIASGVAATPTFANAPRATAAFTREVMFANTERLRQQQSERIRASQQAQADGGGGDGDAGGGGAEFDPMAAYYARMEQQQQQNVIAVVTALFKEYGLETLTPKIVEYVKAGYNSDAIGVLLRDTPEYKARFPAMATLMQKKRAISEAEYIAYERTAAQLEKQYGLPSGMVQGNVTGLLENEVSATELNDRIIMASSAAVSAPEDFKQTLQRYYNVGTGGLAGYFLDPALATPILEKQFQTAQIGTEAVRQGVDLDIYGAQNLQNLGITQEAARQGFQVVAGARGLTAGRGDVVSQQQLISGTFGNEQQQQEIERVRAARTGRFAGGGEFMAERGGVTGLASATT